MCAGQASGGRPAAVQGSPRRPRRSGTRRRRCRVRRDPPARAGVENRRCGPHSARLAAVVMVGHGAARLCDVRPGGVDHQLWRGTPCARARTAAPRRAEAKKPSTAGPRQCWTTWPELRSRAGISVVDSSTGRTDPRLSDVHRRQLGSRAPRKRRLFAAGRSPRAEARTARPGRGGAPRRTIRRTRASARIPPDFADGRRLDAARRGGHDKPPRKRLALGEYILIHSALRYLSQSFGWHGGLAPLLLPTRFMPLQGACG